MSDSDEVVVEVEDAEVVDDVLTNQVEVEDISEAKMLDSKDLDKVEEYFKMKDAGRTFRNDLKDIKLQMEETAELEMLNKKVKELREKVKGDENVRLLTEKIQTTKERMDLLKELIRIELLESAQEEVKRNGRKLKIVNILREMKDEGDKKKKPQKQFFRN